MKYKCFVTGGAGLIGLSVCRELLKRGHEVYLYDLGEQVIRNKTKIPKNVNILIGSILDKHTLTTSMKNCDYVFHLAAMLGVKYTEDNKLSCLEVNCTGTKNVLEAATTNKVKKFIFASSSEVYGEPVEIPQKEATTPLNSKLPYAVVKNLAESYFRTYQKEDNINYTIFRLFNTFGPLQSDDFVITKFINQAIANKDLTVYGDGSQTRTFCYIDDNIDCTIKCLLENKYTNDVLNIGSDEEMSILSLAKLVIKLTKSQSKIIHLPPLKEGDMSRRKPDISKMNSILNRKIVSLEDGITKTYNKLKNTTL